MKPHHALSRARLRLRQFTEHPLARQQLLGTVFRYVVFNTAGRLRGRRVYEYGPSLLCKARVGDSSLAKQIYYGLGDFEEMCFVLHLLRPNDSFVDAGANLGSYSLLAAKCCHVQTIAFEPSSASAEVLRENLRINQVEYLVELHEQALGSHVGQVQVSCGRGAMNHVLARGARQQGELVEMTTLDDAVRVEPTLLKMDIEGYELEALRGARRLLASSTLLGMILELGFGDEADNLAVHELVSEAGFVAVEYDPYKRSLTPLVKYRRERFNTIYARQAALSLIEERLRTGPTFEVRGLAI